MFVKADLALALSFDAAAHALEGAMADGGLISESRRAVTEGLEFVMPVGPRGSHFPAREVIVDLLPARRIGHRLVIELRWRTTGSTGRLFPSLDADLELTAGDPPDTSRLSIIGRYEPPLASLGETLDSVMMSKVATATMTALLREIGNRLEGWAT